MKHRCKELDEMLEKARKLGFRVELRASGLAIYPPQKGLPIYTAHYGERAFHPVRRYLKNVCKVEI